MKNIFYEVPYLLCIIARYFYTIKQDVIKNSFYFFMKLFQYVAGILFVFFLFFYSGEKWENYFQMETFDGSRSVIITILLSGMATISVLYGLYYSSVSSLFLNKYIDFPKKLQDVYLDRVSKYNFFVISYLCISILLCVHIYLHNINYDEIIICLWSIVTIIFIIIYCKLIYHSSGYIDHVSLSNDICIKIKYKLLCINKAQFLNKKRIINLRNEIKDCIELIYYLFKTNSSHATNTIYFHNQLINNLIELIDIYVKQKRNIYYNSAWFYIQNNYEQTEYQYNWFENDILSICEDLLTIMPQKAIRYTKIADSLKPILQEIKTLKDFFFFKSFIEKLYQKSSQYGFFANEIERQYKNKFIVAIHGLYFELIKVGCTIIKESQQIEFSLTKHTNIIKLITKNHLLNLKYIEELLYKAQNESKSNKTKKINLPDLIKKICDEELNYNINRLYFITSIQDVCYNDLMKYQNNIEVNIPIIKNYFEILVELYELDNILKKQLNDYKFRCLVTNSYQTFKEKVFSHFKKVSSILIDSDISITYQNNFGFMRYDILLIWTNLLYNSLKLHDINNFILLFEKFPSYSVSLHEQRIDLFIKIMDRNSLPSSFSNSLSLLYPLFVISGLALQNCGPIITFVQELFKKIIVSERNKILFEDFCCQILRYENELQLTLNSISFNEQQNAIAKIIIYLKEEFQFDKITIKNKL